MKIRPHHHFRLAALMLSALPSVASAYCAGWDKRFRIMTHAIIPFRANFGVHRTLFKALVLKETWVGEDGKEKKLRPPFQFHQPRPWGFDPYMGAFYDLKIETVFKGKPPAILRVFSENTTARFWLRKGQEILAFASPEIFDEPVGKQFTLDTCGNFETFPKAMRLTSALLMAAKRLTSDKQGRDEGVCFPQYSGNPKRHPAASKLHAGHPLPRTAERITRWIVCLTPNARTGQQENGHAKIEVYPCADVAGSADRGL